MSCSMDLRIDQGKTFEFAFRWAEPDLIYKPIGGISLEAPVNLLVPAHGLSDGWPFQIASVKQPQELNSCDGSFYLAKVIDVDNLELNGVNGLDMKPYINSGTIVYYTPGDLTGLEGRFAFRRTVNDTDAVLTGDTSDGRVPIDVTTSTVSIYIGADITGELSAFRGVYDLELFDPNNDALVYKVASGRVTVAAEVTK